MSNNLSDKFTIFFASTEAKANLLLDIARQLQRDSSLSDVADDFEKYGSSLEKMVGKRLKTATKNAKPAHTAMEGIISDMSLEAIKSGEETGKLADGFLLAKMAVENNEGLFGSLVRGHIIPIIKILVVIIGLSVLADYIFSQMLELVPLRKWPSLSQSVYGLTSAINDYKLIIIAMVAMLVTAVGLLCKFSTGSFRSLLDKLPFFKQYRILNASLMLTSIGVLLRADLPMLSAVSFQEKKASRYVAWHLNTIRQNIKRVKNGGTVGQMLDTGLINIREVNRLSRAIAENEIADRIEDSAKDHFIQLEREIKHLNALNKYLFLAILIFSVLTMFASVFFLVLSINQI